MENLPVEDSQVPPLPPKEKELHATLGDALGTELKKKLLELAKKDESFRDELSPVESQKLAS